MKKSKNVLLVVQNNSFPFDRRIKKEACSLKDNGYNVFVISPNSNSDNKKHEIWNGITVRRYHDYKSSGSLIGYLFEYISSITKIYILAILSVIKNKIDVIHVANPPDFFWLLFLILKIFNVKSIYDQHDLAPELFGIKFNNRFLQKILSLNEKLTVYFADAVIVANTSFVKRLKKKWNFNNKPYQVVYNGPEASFNTKSNKEIQNKFVNKKIALFVGLMSTDDNVEVVINLAKEIVFTHHMNDVLFILVGDGDSRAKMEELSKQFNLTDNVYFTGIVSHDVVQEYLHIADVCLTPDLPNGLNENLTLIKVLEYMKAKKAFVGFDLAETKVLAQKAGLYATDMEDYIKKFIYLIENPLVANEMGDLGYKIINENYSWEFQEKKIIQLYQDLLF